MQENKMPKAVNKQAGFSLIELMIAIVLGLLVTAAVTAMTVSNLKMSGNTLKSTRLNQDLGAVMQVMVNDIRRAGYAGDSAGFDTDEDINIVSSTCILYSYDRDLDSSIKEEREMNGFKLEGGRMEIRTSCDKSTHADCSTSCLDAVGNWEPLTDPDVITITEFEIDSGKSKCHNIDEELSIRIKSDSSSIKFACNQDDPSKVQKWAVDGNGDWDWVALSVIPGSSLSSTGTSVGVRHVNISLEAELAKDSSVSKSLDVSIRVRNDHVYK